MAFQSAPQCAEAVIRFSGNTVEMVNVLTFRYSGEYDGDNILELANTVDAWVGAEYLPLVTAEFAYLRTDVRGLTNMEDEFATANAEAGVGGQGSTEALPNNVTWVLKFGTGATGRTRRGRMYWIGIPVNQLNANESFINVTYADAAVAALDALRTAVGAVNWSHVVISRYLNNVQRTTAVANNVVSVSYTDLIIDTQRRRLPS